MTERDLVVVFFPGLFSFFRLLLASFRDRVVSVDKPRAHSGDAFMARGY
ncbi:hypothetical protein [Marinilabilia salmonicolor]|nr:hypothetical protein [Marinilabilia salmonicolor]